MMNRKRNIDRENYEAWLLDRMEGNLSQEELAILDAFLDDHPDLRAEAEEWEPVTLPAPDDRFTDADTLKKPVVQQTGAIDAWNYESFMIGRYEGDLNDLQKESLTGFLQKNPHLKHEFALFGKTITSPPDIIYPEKEQLKKRVPVFLLYPVMRYAAAILVLLLLFIPGWMLVNRNSRQVSGPKVVHIQEMPVRIPKAIRTGENPRPSSVALLRVSEATTPESIEIRNSEIMITLHPLPAPASLAPESSLAFSGIDIKPQQGLQYNLPEKEPGKSFAARLFENTLARVTAPLFRRNKSLIDIGVEGYNLLTDRNLRVEKVFDSQGNVVAYSVEDEEVLFQRRFHAADRP
ncbi:MAG: hypothetical protein Kow00127_21510 [Bacteroidales bacterium]